MRTRALNPLRPGRHESKMMMTMMTMMLTERARVCAAKNKTKQTNKKSRRKQKTTCGEKVWAKGKTQTNPQARDTRHEEKGRERRRGKGNDTRVEGSVSLAVDYGWCCLFCFCFLLLKRKSRTAFVLKCGRRGGGGVAGPNCLCENLEC